jgi:PAS domain S-box-containing protein
MDGYDWENIASLALESGGEAIVITDDLSKAVFTNKGAQKLFKYKDEELIGKSIDQLFEGHPVLKEAGVLKDEELNEEWNEANCVDANGKRTAVEFRVSRIIDERAAFKGLMYLIRDISEVKKYMKILEEKRKAIALKERLAESSEKEMETARGKNDIEITHQAEVYAQEHAKLAASINSLNFGFMILSRDRSVVLYNKASLDFFPLLSSKNMKIDELEKGINMDWKLSSNVNRSVIGKTSVALPDKQINSKYVNVFISPVIIDNLLEPGKKDEALGSVIIIEDRSEEHELEESQEDLFSIASHELRTPLTAIYGYTSLIKQIYFGNIENEQLKDIINKIGLLSKKLSLSVNNFLDTSKLEEGKIELKKEPCDLYTIVSEAISEIERLAAEKNLYIGFDPPLSLITVVGDQTRLIQVLIIFLTNAVKFTQNGGVYIDIEVYRQSDLYTDSPGFVCVRIRDTGAGIPEDNKKLLFSKFQQANENLLTRQEGTGMGLHTAKLLVEKMGGVVNLEKTELNKGSTFLFTVPLMKE